MNLIELFKINDTLNVTYGLLYKNFAVISKFVKKNDQWILVTKNATSQPKSIYNMKMDKEHCLVEQIMETKLGKLDKCIKYDFSK
ncbi:hypothetical protein GCM10022393_30540 [Aquimarina addita]|uniref:Uncharacterized protein n=1 Tax=Aquimarina addita TaxID=870485 RepID=A0ABP6UR14_9FLAO